MEIIRVFICVCLVFFLSAGLIYSAEDSQLPEEAQSAGQEPEEEISLLKLVPKEGLLGYFRFEEEADADNPDQPGNAVITAVKAVSKEGKYGSAMEFSREGAIARTEIRINQEENTAGATFCAFVLPYEHAIEARRQAISTDNSGFDWSILIEDGRWFVFNNADSVDTGINAKIGEWQFISAVFDPEKGITFYCNDESFHIEEIQFEDSTNPLAIGNNASDDMYPECFMGMIDEVLIYERPLSYEEIMNIFGIYKNI